MRTFFRRISIGLFAMVLAACGGDIKLTGIPIVVDGNGAVGMGDTLTITEPVGFCITQKSTVTVTTTSGSNEVGFDRGTAIYPLNQGGTITITLSAARINGDYRTGYCPADVLALNSGSNNGNGQIDQRITSGGPDNTATPASNGGNPATATPVAPTMIPTVTPPAPTTAPAVTATPAATAPMPSATPDNNSASSCKTNPTDLETLPRHVVDSAPFNNWFHPIYDQGRFQSSGGTDGQWSWAHTLCLGTSSGGNFKNFEKNDGRFVFRHNIVDSHQEFAVLTTGQHKAQFMQGNTDHAFSVNIRAMPGTTINILDGAGNQLGSQEVSQGGDLTIILPDDGITRFVYDVRDPATTHETMIWFGPYDRSAGINTFDARKRK